MIAFAPTLSDEAHDQFLALLPTIRRLAALAFRSQPPGMRDDLIQEAVANAYLAYRRLVELDKRELIFPTPLARYAVRQVNRESAQVLRAPTAGIGPLHDLGLSLQCTTTEFPSTQIRCLNATLYREWQRIGYRRSFLTLRD